jgi:hypothetical protein
MAMINMSGINFHNGEANYYNVFTYPWLEANYIEVKPLYYGMYLFAYATRTNSSFVNVTVTSTDGLYLKSWGLLDHTDQTLRVVTIYKVGVAGDEQQLIFFIPTGLRCSSSLQCHHNTCQLVLPKLCPNCPALPSYCH